MSEQIYCDWLDTKVCAVCGKHFSVLYPQLWCYKFGFAKKAIWFCSYGCMRVHDKKKEERIVKKITLNEKKRAVEEALAGNDPREYLKSIGVANPMTCWETIQRYYRTNDAETYRKICEAGFGRKCDMEPVAAQVAKVKITGPVEIETPEADLIHVVETPEQVPDRPKITKPIRFDGNDVCGIRNEFGELYFDASHNVIDWRNTYGDEVSLIPEDWKAFAEKLPNMLRVLGVDA